MIEFLTSRSRRQTQLRCARARYLLDEAFGTGYEPVKLAVPLLTGSSVHKGLARLLRADEIDVAVAVAIKDYESRCTNRQLDLEQLESQSYVFAEQRALVEALVRLAGLRIVPKLLEQYEVLEVERMDKEKIVSDPEFSVLWRSIPDALLLSRADGELYVLSWKTTTEYDQRRDQDARVDMQGLSEPWALEQRLGNWRKIRERPEIQERPERHPDEIFPDWFRTHLDQGGSTEIRGVQMVYLVKGPRRKMSKDQMAAEGLSGGEMKKHSCPLIYGYKKDSAPGLAPPELATSSDWHCSKPHTMRRSQWYPTGECSGDGRLHKRGDEWKSFPVWNATGGVRAWMELLDKGLVTPEAGDPLEQSYAIPVPHFRTRESTAAWLRQTRAAERRNAQDLMFLREFEQEIEREPNDEALWQSFQAHLDLSAFGEQNTEKCGDWFHRKCPAWELCHGPAGIARDPIRSGLFQVKTAYDGPDGNEAGS